MKLSTLGLWASLAARALAEDLLFVDGFEFSEFSEATTDLSLTTKVVTEAEWATMKTEDFAKFKAIVIADPNCRTDPTDLDFLATSREEWGPAVKGNIVLIGTDPSFHFSAQPGAKVLIDNAIKFAASGKTTGGASQTGLYFALSCYYQSVDSAPVPALSYFGDFTVRGNLACYNNAHVVASSPALGTLDDAALSNWGCSVHEAFSKYPDTGVNGFQALAIAKDIIGEGSKPFAGDVVGLPYIISRGATPDGCGDGVWNKDLGEECDDGNTKDGDGCSKSCKCESGRPAGDGKCLPKIPDTPPPGNYSTPPGGNYSTSHYGYGNSTHTKTVTVSGSYPTYPTYPHPPVITDYYHTPVIIGVEIIVYVTIIEDCKTYGGSTVTSYVTSACSTMHKPIWDKSVTGYPCYPCYGVPTSSFITAKVTSCLEPPPSYTYTPPPPVVLPCHTCSALTLSTCPVFTPAPSKIVYEVTAPVVVPHTHKQTDTYAASPTYVPETTKSYDASVGPPTGTYVPYTGGAERGVVGWGVLGGAVAIGMIAL